MSVEGDALTGGATPAATPELAAEAATGNTGAKVRGRALWRALAALPGKRNEVLAVLNGAVGDALERQGSSLFLPMGLVVGGRELDLSADLAPQLADVGPRLVVLAHGLMCTETIWSFPNGSRRGYGERLAADVGATPVYLRYNSGLHISVNGRALADLLERLVDAWPVPIDEISLLGYSMGGLVTRSAMHYGQQTGHRWLTLTRRSFLLAVPLRGSPVEQLAAVAAFSLQTIPNPVTWLLAWVFKQRSAGIKDLRHGYLVDDEWRAREVDTLTLGRKHLVPLPPGVDHFVAAGSLAKDAQHPVGRFVGDVMVAPFSAKDEGYDGTPSERAAKGARVFPGVSHLAMASHDDVYQQLLAWWREGAAPA